MTPERSLIEKLTTRGFVMDLETAGAVWECVHEVIIEHKDEVRGLDALAERASSSQGFMGDLPTGA